MRARAGQLRTLESFSRSVIVEPVLAGLEAVDDRVARGGVMLRRMLAWRTIATADVAAFGASAQVQPPSVRCQAFDATCAAWFCLQIDSFWFTLHACLLLRPDLRFYRSASGNIIPVRCNETQLDSREKAYEQFTQKPRRRVTGNAPTRYNG
jgi:hypothetical protein